MSLEKLTTAVENLTGAIMNILELGETAARLSESKKAMASAESVTVTEVKPRTRAASPTAAKPKVEVQEEIVIPPQPAPVVLPAVDDSDWEEFGSTQVKEVEAPMEWEEFNAEAKAIVNKKIDALLAKKPTMTPAVAQSTVCSRIPDASGQPKLKDVAPANRRAILESLNRLAF